MKLRLLLSAVVLFIAVLALTECGPDDPPPTVITPKDTTTKQTGPVNKFKIGFDIYNLEIDKDQSNSIYYAASDETLIDVTGQSSKAAGGIVAGKGRFIITLKNQGVKKGIYKQANMTDGDLTLEISTGTPPTESKYASDASSNIILEITEYGAVGGRVKGTFSAKLKTGFNIIDVRDGFFDIERLPNK